MRINWLPLLMSVVEFPRMSPRISTAALLSALLLIMSGCEDSDQTSPAEEGDPVEAAAEEITELTFAFQPQENPEGLQLDTERFGQFITEQTGFEVEIFLPTNYSAVVEALRSENADVAYFSGLPYMNAHKMAGAELLVVEQRDGQPYYYSQWYALADSDIEELADLKDRSVAFTSPSSTSGYLFPVAELIEQGMLQEGEKPEDFLGDVVFAGGYQQALLSLVNGRVDAAAASDYALQQYLSDGQREKVKVIAEQGPVPTHGLAIRGALPDDVKDAVRRALLELNDDEHTELLKSVYGAERLVERQHNEHVEALERAYELVDLDERF